MTNVPAVSQAMAVLKLLGRQATPMPAATIARELGLPRSTIYHLLAALGDDGFVVHLPAERRFGLGVAAFELGSAYSRQEPLRRIAAPALARLAAATGHNAHFAVLHGQDVLYVIEERAPGEPSLVTDVGVRLPAPITASGIAMLAALPSPQLAALFPSRRTLVQREGRGPSTLTQLRQLIEDCRRDGYAHEDGSVTAGLASVAAAVLDHRGYPIAAVALTFRSAARRDQLVTEQLAKHTCRAVAAISLGIRGTSHNAG